jgi:peptide/nickel transport system substrate-binding protein
MERKRALRCWALAVALIALALTAGTVSALSTADCPESMPQATRFTSAERSQAPSLSANGTFTLALAADAWTLDPAAAADGVSWLVTDQIYDTLVNYQPGGTLPVPGLAQSWSVSPDDLTWTFTLRPGVKFHDGTAVDAAAVVYNLVRWWDPAHPYHQDFEYFATMFNGYKGDAGCLINGVAAVGAGQVRIVLSRPYSPLLSTLAMSPFAIASPAAIQAGTLATRPVGSGPFRFVAWVPGDQIRLAGNAAYWQGAPLLESLVFQVIADENARLAALQAGTAQGATMDWSYLPTVTLDANLKVLWQPALNTSYLGINRAHGPLGNSLVRQAIAHAIDKQSIVDQLYNRDAEGGQVATQFLPPAMWGRDESLADYAYDPTLARSLLTQAGYPAGFDTTLWVIPVNRWYFPDRLELATRLQADLQAVGITATLVTKYDWPTYLDKVANGEADLFMLGWGSDNGHPDNFFYPNLCDSYLRYGPRDDALCALLEAAWAEDDLPTLLDTYEWASQRVHATLPLLPIGHARTAWVLRRNAFGFEPAAFGAQPFRTLFLADAWADVPPGAAASLVYTDTQGSRTVVQVPAGAVPETTTLAFAAVETVPAGPAFSAGHGFLLAAYRDGQELPGLTFDPPLTVTIEYSDADVASVAEDTLALCFWDGAQWSTDGITVVERDVEDNQLVVTVAHLSRFALLARGRYQGSLPVILRNWP